MFSRIPPRFEDEQKDTFAPVADLMVGVVFIFMILILALSLDLSTEESVPQSTYDLQVRENQVLSQQLAEAKSALAAEQNRRAEAETRVAELDTRIAKLVSSSASCATAKSRR